MVQNLKTAKIAARRYIYSASPPVRTGAAKIKTTKISSGALRGDSAKFYTRENFPLYGSAIHYSYFMLLDFL